MQKIKIEVEHGQNYVWICTWPHFTVHLWHNTQAYTDIL